MKYIVSILSLVALVTTTQGQLLPQLQSKLHLYHLHKGQQSLYLHTDKTHYRQGENLWFTGYQLDQAPKTENVLFVTLHHTDIDTALISAQFILVDGIAKGTLYLNPSLPVGRYRLLAYTNHRINYPDCMPYQQFVEIKSHRANEYAVIRSNEKVQRNSEGDYLVGVQVITSTNDMSYYNNNLNYQLTSDGKVLYKSKITLTTPGTGLITIPKQYAHLPLLIESTFKANKKSRNCNLHLHLEDSMIVKFYPEGGNLVSGLQSNVAFEIKSNLGKHTNLKGKLLQNGKPITTFSTNSYGMGSFGITPDNNAAYTFVLDNGEKLHYTFPEITREGIVLSSPEGVVTNSLEGLVQSTNATEKITIIAHNYKEVFFAQEVAMEEGSLYFQLPTANMPLGINTITILDEQQNPIIERAYYIVNTNTPTVSIIQDTLQYEIRKKVKLKIKVQDNTHKGVPALFSIAAVSANTYDSQYVQSLPVYYYAGKHIAAIHSTLPISNFKLNEEHSELILKTKFWTRYKWKEVQQAPKEEQHNPLSEGIQLYTRYHNRDYKKPFNYLISTDSAKNILIAADTINNNTLIPYPALYSSLHTEVGIITVPKDKKAAMQDFNIKIKQLLLHKEDYKIPYPVFAKSLTAKDTLVDFKSSGMLEEAVIVGMKYENEKNIEGLNASRTIFYSKDCKDYVCINNVLNCPNHEQLSSKPINGMHYNIDRVEGPIVKYIACEKEIHTNFLAKLNGVWEGKEFYQSDYEKDKIETPELHSTIYWNYYTETNANGEAEIEYYTNDLTGNFIIHLQGMSINGPINESIRYRVVTD